MSNKKRGIKLKSLHHADEGMQELINPIPLDLLEEEDGDEEAAREIEAMQANEDNAVKDVLEMLEETHQLLDN